MHWIHVPKFVYIYARWFNYGILSTLSTYLVHKILHTVSEKAHIWLCEYIWNVKILVGDICGTTVQVVAWFLAEL